MSLSLCTNSQRKTEIEIFSPRNIYLFLFGWDGKEYFKSRFQDFPFLIVVRPPSARTDTMLLFVYIEWFCRSVVGVEISLKRRRCNYGPCSCVRLPISALSSKFFTKTNHWLTRFGWMLNKNKWCCVPPRKSDRKLNPIFHYSLARTHLLIILYAHDDGVSHTFANDDKTNNRFCSLNTV